MSQMRDDALSGLLPRYKYLSARYGVSEEDARKLAQEAADEKRAGKQREKERFFQQVFC